MELFNSIPFTKHAYDTAIKKLEEIEEENRVYVIQSLVNEWEDLSKLENHDYMNLGDVTRVFGVLHVN